MYLKSFNSFYERVLPANGNPLTFTKFVRNYKTENNIVTDEKYERLFRILENKKVAELCNIIENKFFVKADFLSLDLEDLILYFSYLHAMRNNMKMDIISKHSEWISYNISFEDLYKIKDKGISLEIKHDSIISKLGSSTLHLPFYN
jgi:hypothetical protein